MAERLVNQQADGGSKPTPSLQFSGLRVELVRRSVVDWMIQKHYLHKWPGVVTKIFGLVRESKYVGVCVYALPAIQINKRYGGRCWELARLWIDDTMPKNSETWFIAKTIILIRKQNPEIEGLVSFADPSAGHNGTIYKAGNWWADGRQDEERKSPRVDLYLGDRKFSRWDRAFRAAEKAGLLRNAVKRVPKVSKFRFFYSLRGDFFQSRLLVLRQKVRQLRDSTI